MNLKMFFIISWVDWCVGKCSIFRLRVGNVIEVMECWFVFLRYLIMNFFRIYLSKVKVFIIVCIRFYD